jgi:hypothetical protein
MTTTLQSECDYCRGHGWIDEDDRRVRCYFCVPNPQPLTVILANQAFDDEFHQELNQKLRQQHSNDTI